MCYLVNPFKIEIMKVFKAYHEGTDVVKFVRIEYSDGYSYEFTYNENGKQLTYKNSDDYSSESTYDENGNKLTYKNSDGLYKIKDNHVTKEEFENFINRPNRPCVGKKVVVDGVEYELK